MPSRMSLFNKEMIKQVGRSVGWISVLYFLGLLFAVPLRIMMTFTDQNFRYFTPIESLFKFDFGLQIILFVSVPVLIAVFLFRFLHVKQAADLMHSMPVKREKIYHFYTITGLLYLIIPVLLIALITSGIHGLYQLDLYFQQSDIVAWTGTVILFNAVFYMAGVFIAMVTGISTVQGVLTYILLLFPAGFSLLIIYNLGMMLYGFPSDYIQARNIEKLTPIVHLSSMESQELSMTGTLVYILILSILYVLSLFIYKKRKVESASEAIAFASLKVIFKYGVAFCTMMFGGMYFDAMENQFGWLLFGYGFGGILGYYVAEMVLQKTWRVFGQVRGLGFFAAAMIIFLLIIQSFAPYEKRVPELNEVKSVTLTNVIHTTQDELIAPQPLKKRENIEKVRELHTEIITNEKQNEQGMEMGEFALFVYELTNGRKMIRQYHIDRTKYEEYFKEIHESLEFKHATHPIFKVEAADVESIRFTDGSMMDKRLMLSDKAEVAEVIDILKKEIENESYDPDFYRRGNRSTIEMKVGEQEYLYADLKNSYKELKGWLENKNLLKQAMVTPDDVDYILVTNESIKEEQHKEFFEQEIFEMVEGDHNTVKVTDKQEIEVALENAGFGWFNEEPYLAIFVYKDGTYKEIRTFSEKHVPSFIKEHFR